MAGNRGRWAVVVLIAAGLFGSAVGGVSALASVGVEDPRPSTGIPSIIAQPTTSAIPTPEPTPTVSASPTPSPSPRPTSEPTVWLYDVQEGDSMSAIAIRFGTTTDRLLRLNPEYAANEDLIEVGAQVIVPCTEIAVAEGRC